MNKTLVVARTEYINAVTSKAFIIGVLMMPLFVGGTFVVQYLTRDQVDTSDRKVAIVDHTGKLFPIIAAQAKERNKTVFDTDELEERKQKQPNFIVERFEPPGDNAKRPDVVLSERVRRKELFRFLIISADGRQTDRRRGRRVDAGDRLPERGLRIGALLRV